MILSAVEDVFESGGKVGQIPELWDGNTAKRIADALLEESGGVNE